MLEKKKEREEKSFQDLSPNKWNKLLNIVLLSEKAKKSVSFHFLHDFGKYDVRNS